MKNKEINFKNNPVFKAELKNEEDNLFPYGIDYYTFCHSIIDYLLGEDWYGLPTGNDYQVMEVALDEILTKYSKRYRKEIKMINREYHKKYGKEK